MDGRRLQDRINRGLGTAARVIGVVCDAYRPGSPSEPLQPTNRYLRLTAAFNAQDPHFVRTNSFGTAVWYGVFDAAYTQPGDYLVEHVSGTAWFIAAQQPLLPALCVKANRVVSFGRAAAPQRGGTNTYGGVTQQSSTPVLTEWPASVLVATPTELSQAGLPGDVRLGSFSVLLPAWNGTVLRPGDLMTDDIGRNFAVSTAELSEFGWRLGTRQVAS